MNVASCHLHLTGMDACAYADAKFAGRHAYAEGADNGPSGTVEHGQEAVTGRAHLTPSMGLQEAADVLAVSCQEPLPRSITKPFCFGRRADDVGEEHGRKDTLARLRRLPKVLDPLEVNGNVRLVAEDPGVMAGRDVEHVARDDFAPLAVSRFECQAPGEHITDVMELAAVRTDDRLHMGRPTPPRLKDLAADRQGSDPHQFHRAVLEPDCLVGLSVALDLDPGHRREFGRRTGDRQWRRSGGSGSSQPTVSPATPRSRRRSGRDPTRSGLGDRVATEIGPERLGHGDVPSGCW